MADIEASPDAESFLAKNQLQPRALLLFKQQKGYTLPPDQVFESKLSWEARVLLKQQYALVAQQLKQPLFDEHFVRQGLRSLLDRLKPFAIPLTVVLSPLPCADHMARRFRLDSARIFEEESIAANVHWLHTGLALGVQTASRGFSERLFCQRRLDLSNMIN